jgi:hypothetical protein
MLSKNANENNRQVAKIYIFNLEKSGETIHVTEKYFSIHHLL